MMRRLTDLMIRKLPLRKGAYFYRDPEMRHHGVRIQPGGTKNYTVVCYDPLGKQKWATVGSIELMTLAEARKKAGGMIRRIKAGLPAREPPTANAQKKFLEFIKGGIKPVCYLYRHYHPSGDLLYVGISLAAIARLAEHADRAAWWKHVHQIVIEPFATREQALQAEEDAIRTEYPKYNLAMNGRQSPIKELARLNSELNVS